MRGIIEQWNEFSTGLKIISLIMVCCIGLVLVGGIIGALFPDLNTSQQMINNFNNDVNSNAGVADSDGDLKVKITCAGSWSASVSDGTSTDSYEGTGDEVIKINKSDISALGVAAHKKSSGSDKLKIEIVKDGKVVAKNSTTTTDVISTSATINSKASANDADDGVKIKITCPVSWSASVGDTDNTVRYEGDTNKVITVDESKYDVIAASVQKKTSGNDKLKVEIIKDGKVLDKESTTKEYGVVTVSATL